MTTGLDLTLRPERPEDVEAIARVTAEAFRDVPVSQQTEPFIIDALRRAGALALSLVAESGGRVVGHVAFSPATIADGTPDWYLLGPIAVAPALQRQGIGRALVRAGLDELTRGGARGCVLVGDPAYYERFGFRSHPRCTMDGVPPRYVLMLALGGHPPAEGRVGHHDAFHARGPGA